VFIELETRNSTLIIYDTTIRSPFLASLHCNDNNVYRAISHPSHFIDLCNIRIQFFFFYQFFFLQAYLLNDLHAFFKHDCYCYVRVVRHRDTNLFLLRKSIRTDGRLQFFQNGVRGVRAQIEIRSNSVWVLFYKNNFGRRQSFWVRKRWRSRRRV